ncbi:MAG: hypothetical protein HUJ96_01855 [Marinilabiliaceae bacterium]|nr:hypothetical protein [Marinilabiliaceae bacterium]
MKNIFKYLSLVVISSLVMTACNEEGPDYEAGELSGQTGVSFPSSAKSSYVLLPTESSFEIPVIRSKAQSSSAGSYTLQVITNEDDRFVLPSSVEFAAGSWQSSVAISIQTDGFDIGATKQLELSFDEGQKDPYSDGVIKLSTKVTRDYIWNDLGETVFTDSWLGAEMKTHLYQRDDDGKYFRFDFPYDDDAYEAGGASDMVGGLTQSHITFTVDENGIVNWDYWYTGLTYDGSEDYSIVAFQPSYLSESLSDGNTVVYYNEDGSIAYVAFSPYYYVPGLGGWGEKEAVLYWPDYEAPAEEEEEEEAGKDFAAGMTIEDYCGEYEMTYKYNLGKQVTEDVTITDNGDGTVTIASFDEGVSFVAQYFGGLLYIESQPVVIAGYEDYNFGLYMTATGDELYDDVYLYAGFDAQGVLKIKDYPYNITLNEEGKMEAAPKMIGFYVYDFSAGAWGMYSDFSLVKKSANKSARNAKPANVRRFITDAKIVGEVNGRYIRK